MENSKGLCDSPDDAALQQAAGVPAADEGDFIPHVRSKKYPTYDVYGQS